jgi:DUF4097 and DUF4098 domain-containing protein YvlB
MSMKFLAAWFGLTTLYGFPAAAQDFTWRGKVAVGKTVEIKGINGGVNARPTTGSEVQVTATKRAKRSDTASVKIDVIQDEDGVTICAVYPSGNSARPNTCTTGEHSHSDVRDNDVQVEFTVLVPAGVRFTGRTVNGGVQVDGLDAEVRAYTVNGGITLSTKGLAEASTVNGGISATLGRADWKDEAEFSTVNGSVTLTLPASLGAELEASTVNGSIDSDFPLLVHGRISPKKITGTIGSGGPELKLSTVNGSIRLRKAT